MLLGVCGEASGAVRKESVRVQGCKSARVNAGEMHQTASDESLMEG